METTHQSVDLVRSVVHPERGAHRGRDVEAQQTGGRVECGQGKRDDDDRNEGSRHLVADEPEFLDELGRKFDLRTITINSDPLGPSSPSNTGVTLAARTFDDSVLDSAAVLFRARGYDAAVAFQSAEDLTCLPVLSLQQDLAVVAALGFAHCERNGHHYAYGMSAAPEAEQEAFLAAHPDVPILDDGDLVHFVFRGDVDDLMLKGNMEPWERERPMARLPDTDLYFRTVPLEPGGRFVMGASRREPGRRSRQDRPRSRHWCLDRRRLDPLPDGYRRPGDPDHPRRRRIAGPTEAPDPLGLPATP